MEVEEALDTSALENNTTTNIKNETDSGTVPNDKDTLVQVNQSTKQEPTQVPKAAASTKPLNENAIPGGPSTMLSNKAISSIQQEAEEEDDDLRSQTPKL